MKKLPPSRFAFLLLDDFTLISLSAAIEPLRMANRILGKDSYEWKIISATGAAVFASDGISMNVDSSIEHPNLLENIDMVIVCGGVDIETHCDKNTNKWLKTVARRGLALGAICTGSFVLAEAGLLNGYECSIHWENLAMLRELHPRLNVNTHLFSIDRTRYTSSGGTAPIDMFLDIISKQHGNELCSSIAEQFICDRIRHADDIQRVPLRYTLGTYSKKLTVVIELMEANMEEPISQKDLAEYAHLSTRQLERLFQKYLFCTPSRYYLRLRLQRARYLLRHTGLSVLDVASACGFVSTSHFSKTYKEFFGYPPTKERLK